jgi:TonB family protein
MVRDNETRFGSHARRILIAAVILSLVLLAIGVRPTAVDVFFHRVDLAPPDTAYAPVANDPRSVISIHIDPETDASGVIDVTPPPPPPPPRPAPTDTATVQPERPQEEPQPDLDVELDQAAGPRGTTSAADIAAVPPRPIEITWPETRQLKQCIGQSVNVRIWVSEQGKVKDVKVVPSGVMPACVDAALSAARHIRFEPGRQGGVAVTMWTEVRIDFQRRD